MDNYKTAIFNPSLSDSESFEQWQEQGSKDSMTRAHEAYKAALEAYQAPELDSQIDERLQEYIKARKEILTES